MLVLSRKIDESIMIGDDVEIMVVDVREEARPAGREYIVRLGIIAPKHTTIHRKEIYDAIQREKAQKDAVTNASYVGGGSYFKCAGAYESKEIQQDAYIEVSQSGKKLSCTSLDKKGDCCLRHLNHSNKCPHNIEKML